MSQTTELQAEIEALENEIRAKHEKLVELRTSLDPEIIEDYVLLDGQGAPVKLSDLFGDKKDLILIHNMGSECPYCTLWADGFNGVLHHIEDRAAFVVASPDPTDVQKHFAAGRGWKFRMVSDPDKRFTTDMGFTTEHEGRLYMLPGYSTFKRHPDGTVFRVASDQFGPGDPYCSIWHMFPLLDGGTGAWQPQFHYPHQD